MQRHDCLIHQFSTCLPKKGVRRTTKGNREPGPGFQPRANIQPMDRPAHASYTNEENPSHRDENLQNKIELVWEARAVRTTDHTQRLEGLSDEKLITGTAALMNIVQNNTKPTSPKKKKKYGYKFCRSVFVSSSNRNKHIALYHVLGARFRIQRESSLICIHGENLIKMSTH